jgi:hypothetical protein
MCFGLSAVLFWLIYVERRMDAIPRYEGACAMIVPPVISLVLQQCQAGGAQVLRGAGRVTRKLCAMMTWPVGTAARASSLQRAPRSVPT